MAWDYMDWGEFATLFTGIAAVLAAYGVGQRQARILEAQHQLGELSLRSTLFEKRVRVYDATRRWLAYIAMHGAIPGRVLERRINSEGPPEGSEIERDFLEQLDRARFLFRPAVFAELDRLWKLANKVHYHQRAQRNEREICSQQRHVDAEHDAMTELLNVWSSDLASVFGSELNLSNEGGTFGPRPQSDD